MIWLRELLVRLRTNRPLDDFCTKDFLPLLDEIYEAGGLDYIRDEARQEERERLQEDWLDTRNLITEDSTKEEILKAIDDFDCK